MMRVLVCGGRNFHDQQLLNRTLDSFHAQTPITLLIHGDARGADKLAASWARLNGVPVKPFPADWEQFGKGAGRVRNYQMLNQGKPDQVIAFPGGRGTENMILQARFAGVKTLQIGES